MKINHANGHISTQTEDMDMLDTNVSTISTNENRAMKLISPINIINSQTNNNPTLSINQLNQNVDINPSLTKSSEQNLSNRYENITLPPKHVVQMSSKENSEEQMASLLEHGMYTISMKDHAIKQTLVHSKDMQIEAPIITLSTNLSHC